MLLTILVTGGVLAGIGWLFFGPPVGIGISAGAQAHLIGRGNMPSLEPATVSGNTPAPRPVGTAGASAGASITPAAQQLLTHVPAGFAGTCRAVAVSGSSASQGADAEVACQPEALGSDGFVTYTHYQTPGAMQAAYAGLAQGMPFGDCTSGNGQGSYRQGSSQPVGGYACVSTEGQNNFAWTDNRLSILSVATSDTMTLTDLYQWWLHSDTGPG